MQAVERNRASGNTDGGGDRNRARKFLISGSDIDGMQSVRKAGALARLRFDVDRSGAGINHRSAGDTDLRHQIGATHLSIGDWRGTRRGTMRRIN